MSFFFFLSQGLNFIFIFFTVHLRKASVVDNMIAMMEKYTNNLEDIVAERTEQLQEEKLKTDALLYRMLPRYSSLKKTS